MIQLGVRSWSERVERVFSTDGADIQAKGLSAETNTNIIDVM